MLKLDADRFLYVFYSEWKSDTYANVALIYDISARVLDGRGTVLAESNVSGRDHLGGSFFNPPAHAAEAVPVAFRQKLEQLLGSPDVASALE